MNAADPYLCPCCRRRIGFDADGRMLIHPSDTSRAGGGVPKTFVACPCTGKTYGEASTQAKHQ